MGWNVIMLTGVMAYVIVNRVKVMFQMIILLILNPSLALPIVCNSNWQRAKFV